jgi:hypothetical protein
VQPTKETRETTRSRRDFDVTDVDRQGNETQRCGGLYTTIPLWSYSSPTAHTLLADVGGSVKDAGCAET